MLDLGSEADSGSAAPRWDRGSRFDLVPACRDEARRIRVIAGPQFDAFDDEAKATFFGSTFSVSNLTDRQGARLEGSEVPAIGGKHDIVSDPAYMGAVQIPADGKPIILLADRQPTGGYAKIASVISADLPAVVQKTPGSEIGFELIDVSEAQELAAEFRRSIHEKPYANPSASTLRRSQWTGNPTMLNWCFQTRLISMNLMMASFTQQSTVEPELAAKIESSVL